MSMNKKTPGFKYAFQGIAHSFRNQLNFRIHVLIALIVVTIGWYIGLSPVEWCIILISMAAVLTAELFNTSIEQHVDATHPLWNEAAGKTKDIAAAAVLVVSFFSAIIGLIIFVPRIIEKLN
jgi:undecaprenol kinase